MKRSDRGFSLVEILVVMALMGIVVMAIYSLYGNTHRTANTSEEIVEVQQNLRFAMDQIARDIRMAGFLIPGDQTPIVNAPERSDADCDDNCFTLNTSMPIGRYARIVSSIDAGGGEFDLTVATAEMVDLFEAGNGVVILHPSTGGVLAEGTISGKNRTARRLTFSTSHSVTLSVGDIIAPLSAAYVVYRLASDGGGNNVFRLLRNSDHVAGNLSDLRFRYILANGDEIPAVESDALSEIVAVRVFLEGQTDETRTGRESYSGVKTRQLESVVKLRNR